MSDETNNMIDAAANNDGAAFKAGFDAVINQKVGDVLDVQRRDIAQNVFGNVRIPTQNEEAGEVNEAPKDAADAKRRAAKVEADDRERIIGRQQARRKKEAAAKAQKK